MMQGVNHERGRDAEGEHKGCAQPINLGWGYIVVLGGGCRVGGEREPLFRALVTF